MRRAPGNDRFLVSAACLIWLSGLYSGFASAAERERKQAPEPEVKVEHVMKLRPEPGSEVLVPDFGAYFISDGSVTIRGRGNARAGAPAQGFDFEVDLKNGTYKTRRLDPKEIEERDRSGQALPEPPPRAEQSSEKVVVPDDWRGRLRIQTRDPVFVVLTETTTGLTWRVDSSGAVAALSHEDICWAANPSSLGTYWYVDFCLQGAPYMSSGRVCNANRGDYHNWDFGSPVEETTVVQYAYICGRNDGFYEYEWSHNDDGEADLLIYGSVLLG